MAEQIRKSPTRRMRKTLWRPSALPLWLVFGVCLAMSLGSVFPVRSVFAMPLERFESPLKLRCEEGQRLCSTVLRVPDALGRHTGIALTKSVAGEASVEISRSASGRFALEAEGVSDLTLTLSWDGDSNPEQLSGAGLNCIDVTQQGASAFIVSSAEMRAECGEVITTSECPSFSVEARVYNPADPTGQKFLVSLGRRTLGEMTDVVIPFSNFLGQGPRGKASFACVGAVTIAFTFRGFNEFDFTFGPIYSNGLEGLTPLPTPTRIPTETPTVTPTATAADTATATSTVTPTLTHTPMLTRTPVISSTSEAPVTAGASASRGAEPLESATPAATPVGVAPEMVPQRVVTPQVQEIPTPVEDGFGGEAVYGELVAE